MWRTIAFFASRTGFIVNSDYDDVTGGEVEGTDMTQPLNKLSTRTRTR